ncbi:MAG: peptidylprolyl isomerase [Bacteroidetes bacterium]|nr:peptidylprolyl isomerase [Bacteroidota bacterium]
MRFTILLLCAICLIGCASMKHAADPSAPKVLLKQPLPPIPESITRLSFDLEVALFILQDGSASKAKMTKGSGDAEWDTVALASIKSWRFSPAKHNGQPVNSWFFLRTNVRVADMQIMNLAEILCTTRQEADTVYKAISEGRDFGELAMKYSVSPTREMKGFLGKTNISMYPEYVSKELEKLRVNEYTKPIKYGDLYAIFMRRN